jgi:hypothetical protein
VADRLSKNRSPLSGRALTGRAEVRSLDQAGGCTLKAVLAQRRGLWRTVEIQGKHKLADLDAILRAAFEHDPSDHLGGFWKRIRRGQGKRFRDVDLGTVDPLGEGEGAGVRIAGLGLEPGGQLTYVYDFGDWIEHRLSLEAIVEPEAEAGYPRVVARNRPKYQPCGSCLARGQMVTATWICFKCSDEQEKEVLVCEGCLERDHDEHWAGELLY